MIIICQLATPRDFYLFLKNFQELSKPWNKQGKLFKISPKLNALILPIKIFIIEFKVAMIFSTFNILLLIL